MRALFLLWWLFCASAAQAQPTTVDLETISPAPTGEWDFEGGKFHLPETTVASLPAAGTSGRIYIVTDTHGTLCASSGGGTTRLICRDTGAAWEAIGSGGGGGGTECSTSACNLNASTTLNSQGICLSNGTNCPGVVTPTPTTTSTAATPTPTATATTTPVACATDGLGRGGVIAAHPEKCGVPIVTATPTPTVTATATATVTVTPTPTVTVTATPTATSTAIACSANSYDAVIGPDVGATCVPAVTPVVYVTPTPYPTWTPIPTQTPVPTPGADPAMTSGQCFWGVNGIVCQGTTAANELHMTFVDPTADRTLTLPNETGTFCTTGSVCTGYMGTSTVLGTSQNSSIHGNDDIDRCYGTDTDWCVRYDETTDDGLRWGANANGAGATTKPMFGILGDYDTANGTNITADQMIFGVGKGTRGSPDWVLTVDEDGDTVIDGTLTGNVDMSAKVAYVPVTAVTPAPTPTAAGNIKFNTFTKTLTIGDGTNAVKVNSFIHGVQATILGGASTTANYYPLFATGAQNPGTTESQRSDVAPVDVWCDEIRVCGASTDAAAEDVTITVRDDGADTALACSMDGDSATATCTGASTQKGCRTTLAKPVNIAQNSITGIKIQCAGASCPSTNLIWFITLRCWVGQ